MPVRGRGRSHAPFPFPYRTDEVFTVLSELQQYLRHAAAHHRDVIRSGPFQVHVDPHADQPYANYAIPDADAQPSDADVDALVAVFEAAGRQPAFEFLPECAPAVERALLAAGF